MMDSDIRLDAKTQAEVDDRIAQMKASLPRDPMVIELVAFAEGLDATADPNVRRIQLAARTIVTFQRLSAPEFWESSAVCDAVTDVLTDLMHLCPIVGEEFDALLTSCREHFELESVNPWL